ncbi:hypothetical protein CPC08DRAFT_434435 [Agrocybe pediades]|nr:hypothetical protein CPC08DRAFT_434435 [Agrocybe pediades]
MGISSAIYSFKRIRTDSIKSARFGVLKTWALASLPFPRNFTFFMILFFGLFICSFLLLLAYICWWR